MAVLVQELIAADVSAVVFSANPIFSHPSFTVEIIPSPPCRHTISLSFTILTRATNFKSQFPARCQILIFKDKGSQVNQGRTRYPTLRSPLPCHVTRPLKLADGENGP